MRTDEDCWCHSFPGVAREAVARCVLEGRGLVSTDRPGSDPGRFHQSSSQRLMFPFPFDSLIFFTTALEIQRILGEVKVLPLVRHTDASWVKSSRPPASNRENLRNPLNRLSPLSLHLCEWLVHSVRCCQEDMRRRICCFVHPPPGG